MKILYLDCGMGAAGDMLCAALYELLDDGARRAYVERMNGLGLEGVEVFPEPAQKCGIVGTHMRVSIRGHEEHEHEHHHKHEHEHEHHHEHEHEHQHEHEHHHEHHHSGVSDVEGIIDAMPVSEGVKQKAKGVYGLIAEAESHAHGRPVSEIHFHEVGTLDAIADVVGFCLLMEELAPDRVVCSPVTLGFGHVHCAHGILPVPAPATAYIMRGAPVLAGNIEGELLTPTGAALLQSFVSEYAQAPQMRLMSVGYGMGKKDFPRANCVRAMLGQTQDGQTEELIELRCDVDDMTAERIGFAMEKLFEGGALDVRTTPVGMKKSRPGTEISVLCREEARDELLKIMFRHTTTLGIRETRCLRHTLERSTTTLSTGLGQVRLKEASGFGVAKAKYEYEDLARIANERDLAIDEVAEMIDKGLI